MSDATTRPLIGITTSEIRPAHTVSRTPQSEPPRREIALGLLYPQAIAAQGGVPVVLPAIAGDVIQPLLGELDGLCLSGGPDLDPSTYGAEPHPELGPTEPEVDEFELALTRAAYERELPILAICRGQQTLNVARGGTLTQHLPDIEGTIVHRRTEPGGRPAHPIEIERSSRLAAALGTTSLDVNTFHHQAVRELGRSLRAVAWAPDGVVEAVESSEHPFCIGVQWHAETMSADERDERLFAAFVEAASVASSAGTPA